MGRIGETIIRTWQTAHVMKQRRGALPGDGAGRQPAGPPLRGQVHDRPGGDARPGRRDRLGRAGQAGRPGAVGAGLLRRPAARRAQGRRDRLGAHGRRERLDPDAAAAAAAADVRRVRRAAGPARRALRLARRARGRAGRPLDSERRLVPTRDVSGLSKADLPENDALPADRGRPRDVRGPRRRRAHRAASPPPSCRWPSATSCSDGARCDDALLLLLLDSRAPGRGAPPLRRRWRPRSTAGLVTRPGRRGGLLPGRLRTSGSGRAAFAAASPPARARPDGADVPRAALARLLDAEYEARIAVRGDARRRRVSSAAGCGACFVRCFRRRTWRRRGRWCAGPAPHHPLVLGRRRAPWPAATPELAARAAALGRVHRAGQRGGAAARPRSRSPSTAMLARLGRRTVGRSCAADGRAAGRRRAGRWTCSPMPRATEVRLFAS